MRLLIQATIIYACRSLDKAKGGVPEAVSGESESNALLGRSLPGVKQGRSSSSPYASRDIYVEAREQEAEARSAAMKVRHMQRCLASPCRPLSNALAHEHGCCKETRHVYGH